MPGRHGRPRGLARRKFASLVAATALASAISPLYLVAPAEAAAVGDGSLVIHKSSGNDSTTVFPFTVDPGATPVAVTGNSDSTPLTLPEGTAYSISESVPPGWILTGAFCVTQDGRLTGGSTATGADNITITAGETTTCYVSDNEESADLSLVKNASPSTFTGAGETITYTLTATNTGQGGLIGVTISDPMLGGDLTDCTDGVGSPVTPPVPLNPGDVLRCTGTYQTTASDVSAGQVVNTATARGFEAEEVSVYHTATATITQFVPPPPPPPSLPPPPPPSPTPSPSPTGSPALGVTKTSMPATGSVVHRGDQVTYTLGYSNTGTAGATGVVVSDALPTDLGYLSGSASNGGTYDAMTHTVTWQLGALADGANGTVTFTADVAQTATDGEVLHNVGVITAGGVDLPSNSDDVTVDVPAPPPALSGDVTISKTVDKHVAEYGDTLTYTVTVGATGNKAQTHVVAKDDVPDGTTYVAGSATCTAPCQASERAGVVTWNVGTLEPGTSTDLTFAVKVYTPAAGTRGGIPAEQVSNIARVTFDADPIEFSNEVSTGVQAVLGEKVTKPDQPESEPDVLPMTGLALPLPLTSLLTMATAAMAVGSVLILGARRRTVVAPVALVQWRDQ